MDIAERTLQLKQDFDEVYEAGKKAEYDEFWDKYQKGGKRLGYGNTTYMYGGVGWNDDTFYPKYDIDLEGAGFQTLFNYNRCTNLKQRLEECGVKITSTSREGITQLNQAFVGTTTRELPPIYNVTGNKLTMTRFAESSNKLIEVPYYDFFNRVTDFVQAFNGCTSLVRVVGIDFSSATSTNKCFQNCSSLSDITVYGTIPVTINFAVCPLSVTSLKSIITALKQFDAYTYTLTLKASAFAELEAEGATAEYNGVACTWAELIDNKKWNLVKG